MAIDIQREQLVGLGEVPQVLAALRRGRKIHLSTAHRWASKGLRGVRLETLRMGGSRVTSIEALQRFFERVSHAHRELPAPTAPGKRIERIDRELDRRGF